jgi:hypothetical protein
MQQEMSRQMRTISFSIIVGAIVFATLPASAKDPLELTRECMIRHGAVRKPDGGVWLSGPRDKAEAIRAKCRKQSGYTG